MKKRFVAMAMACVMGIGLLAGCGSNGGAQTGTGNETAGKETTEAPAAGEESSNSGEVVTLKWIQVGNGMPTNYDAWLAQINPYLEEKIGVNVDMEIVPWGDWDNRRSVIVNSGEAFDILFTDQARYNSEVATGAFLDMTDLLKTSAPDLYSMIPEDYWRAASINGKVYGVPTYKDSSVTEYFIWDKAVADKYNIDINTVNDFTSLYDALKTIKDGEGTEPYYMSKSGADFLVTAYFDQLGAGLSALGVKYNDDTKTVVNPLEDEDILKNLDIIHQMYKEGIINGDAPTADDANKYRTFFTAQGWSGAAASTWGPNNGIEDCVAVQYGDTVVSNTSVRGSLNAIYSGCEHPDKALELLQLVNTDSKVRDWLYYGVEGENFNYTDDGKIEKLNSDWSMAGYTQGTFFNVSQLAETEVNQWDEVKELNANAEPSVMLGFDMDTSSVETELASCRAVYEKYKSEFWTGARDPRELIEVIKGELDAAGWETIRVEAQKQVDAAE
ncbi:ABC transporter substrate-binding protein [Kineothrix sedimenti]|uniref:ABC transporter substrate-binding protein n=1 Tax=Kineothrix sedimenti TaxID=3123317 RepID=A0ABZ3F2V5_9FIRM